jgi:hypothetical protein
MVENESPSDEVGVPKLNFYAVNLYAFSVLKFGGSWKL